MSDCSCLWQMIAICGDRLYIRKNNDRTRDLTAGISGRYSQVAANTSLTIVPMLKWERERNHFFYIFISGVPVHSLKCHCDPCYDHNSNNTCYTGEGGACYASKSLTSLTPTEDLETLTMGCLAPKGGTVLQVSWS